MFNFVLSLSFPHTGHWKFNMAPHDKELSEDLKKIFFALHKDGVKIAVTVVLNMKSNAQSVSLFSS